MNTTPGNRAGDDSTALSARRVGSFHELAEELNKRTLEENSKDWDQEFKTHPQLIVTGRIRPQLLEDIFGDWDSEEL